nr:DUF2218 domain-containing protein [Chromobacterium sp. ASV5]
MFQSRTQLTVPNADKVMYKLCKHFALKVPATFDSETALIHFDDGDFRVQRQDDLLTLRCEAASADQLAFIQSIVDDHLGLMAKQPDLRVEWTVSQEANA